MADDNQSTDLAVNDAGEHGLVAGSDIDGEGQNPDLGERSSSKFDMAVGDLDLLRQVVLVLSISICVALIVMLFFWVKEPEMRPLGTYQTAELIETLEFLDQQKVAYEINGDTVLVATLIIAAISFAVSVADLLSASL